VEILGSDIVKLPSEFIDETLISMIFKYDLLKRSDFVGLNADLNSRSFYMIGKTNLSR
jgi:hypothetical protein